MHSMTERFTDALHRIDSDRDVQPMIDLTGDDAHLVKLDEHHETQGKDGAKTFWEDYRNVFGDLETTFTHSVVGESSAALEWTSTGTLRSGKPFRYRGVTIWKCPLDLWLYQELLHELRPRLIVETGTAFGGSAYFLGDVCDTLGLDARITTIDIEPQPDRPQHSRVDYVTASSTAPDVVARVYASAPAGEPVLVILDSDHSRDHVLAELRAYADLVTVGSYVVVEDTNVNGHPAYPDFGPGPMEAVDAFLAEDDRAAAAATAFQAAVVTSRRRVWALVRRTGAEGLLRPCPTCRTSAVGDREGRRVLELCLDAACALLVADALPDACVDLLADPVLALIPHQRQPDRST